MSAPTKPQFTDAAWCPICWEMKRGDELARGWAVPGFGFLDYGDPVCGDCAKKAAESMTRAGYAKKREGGSDE